MAYVLTCLCSSWCLLVLPATAQSSSSAEPTEDKAESETSKSGDTESVDDPSTTVAGKDADDAVNSQSTGVE